MTLRIPTISCGIFFALWSSARAIIFDSTSNTTFNTSAPTGSLANSGWQYEGSWGLFLGTAIAPNYFITAEHIGGSVGDKFTLNGTDYTTTAVFDDPNSDLRIWQVDGTFPFYAPLYTSSDEVGQNLVVIGRGTQRGTSVVLNGFLKGWQWGTSDNVERWGTNQVAGIASGGAGLGSFLAATFTHGAGTNEADLSVGDSGGAVFIEQSGVWKLAGINYAVDGPYSASSTGSNSFNAALFDQSGYYVQSGSGWVAASGAGSFYASRISSNQTWITSVIPEPPSITLLVPGLGLLVLALRKRIGRV